MWEGGGGGVRNGGQQSSYAGGGGCVNDFQVSMQPFKNPLYAPDLKVYITDGTLKFLNALNFRGIFREYLLKAKNVMLHFLETN